MACTCNHSVSIIILDHHDTEGKVIFIKDLGSLLDGHALSLTCLVEKIYIFIHLGSGLGIDDGNFIKIHFEPSGTIADLLLISDHDDICDAFLDDLGSCKKGSLVIAFGKNDGFLVDLSSFFYLVYISHKNSL